MFSQIIWKRHRAKHHNMAKKAIIGFVILLVTYLALSPVLENGFTNWDDPKYILDNHIIKDLSWERTKSIFLDEDRKSGLYAPLTYLSWAVEFNYVRLDPYLYHLDNLLLHLLNTGLLYAFILLLTGRIEIAVITAILFGVHPMHVESVSWITERKDVLYTFFFLLSLLCYTRYVKGERKKVALIISSFILFWLSLLSKPAAVTLPLILIALDYYLGYFEKIFQGKKPIWGLKIILEKIPFLGLSVIWGIITINTTRSIADGSTFSILERLLFAFYGTATYLYKLIIPIELSCFYPYPRLNEAGMLPIMYYLAPVITLLLLYLVYRSIRHTRVALFGTLFFFFTIALVLQFFPVGPNIITDRYTYVPYIGVFFIIGSGFAYIQDNFRKELKQLSLLFMVFVIGLFSYLSYQRCHVWKNSETLWTDVISKYPNISEGYLNRGQYFTDNDQFNKALADYNVTLQLNPKTTLAYINRGNVYGRQGLFDEALADYTRAIALDATASKVYLNRGNVYGMQGLIDSSIIDYTTAISLERNYLDAYINRAISHSKKRDFTKAFADFNKALEINPNSIKTYSMRAYAYLDNGNYDRAISDYSILIETSPEDFNPYFYRGLGYQKLNKFQQAINDYSMVLKLSAGNSSAYLNRSICYESVRQYKLALKDAMAAKTYGQQIGEQYLMRLQRLAEGN